MQSDVDEYRFIYEPQENDDTVWRGQYSVHCVPERKTSVSYYNVTGLVPYDGVARNETVSIHPAITGVSIVLASLGILFGIGCLIFNFIYRKKRYTYKRLQDIGTIHTDSYN